MNADQLTQLLKRLPPSLVSEATDIAIARLKLTPEKLALILMRAWNPDEIPGETEEARLRGVSPITLRKMKNAKEISRVIA